MLLPLRSRFTSPPTLKKTRKITFQNLFPTEQTLRNEHSFSLKKNIYKISKIPSKSSNEMVTKLSLSLSNLISIALIPERTLKEAKRERKTPQIKFQNATIFSYLIERTCNQILNFQTTETLLLDEGLEGNFLLEIIIRIISGRRRKAYVRRR